jgi:GTP cyclohydrolase I
MSPSLRDILKELDEIAPFSMAEEWDNPGLQVGSPSDKISKILVSLDPTLRAVQWACKRKAGLLLTHHPLIFKPVSCIDRDAYPCNIIGEALRSDVSIVALHTNLDMAKGGINDILAQLIGLQSIEALPTGSTDGLGRIGNLPEEMSLFSVASIIMKAFKTTALPVMGPKDKIIKRIAIVGGSGGGEIPRASERGADLFVTGDNKHHEALQAEANGLALIDAGHYNMERAAMEVFAKNLDRHLKGLGWEIDVEIYKDEMAPMTYVTLEDAK